MIGERGIAKGSLAPAGYIQIHGELWRAERFGEGPPIEAGQPVIVKQMEGLTLFVVPESDGQPVTNSAESKVEDSNQ